jgi:hypothetical protein
MDVTKVFKKIQMPPLLADGVMDTTERSGLISKFGPFFKANLYMKLFALIELFNKFNFLDFPRGIQT